MNPFSSETLSLILLFFVPGFVSMKVYDLIIPSPRRDFSKSLLDAISFSMFNFAILYWLIVAIHDGNFPDHHPVRYFLAILFIVFVAPVIWTFLYMKILNTEFMRRRTLHPIAKPWDYVFSQKQSFWVILHLKDGRRIGGSFDTSSFASSYPAPEQIYLEAVWQLDDTGKFLQKVERTGGILMSASEIYAIELFNNEGDSNGK